MFEHHFGLRENPFVAGHQPRYVYPSREHQEALAHLRFGIENREPFVLITGEVGTGKTTAIYDALAEWKSEAVVALITNSALTRSELLEEICLRFNFAVASPISKPQVTAQLERHLLALKARGERAILILDEAQNLDRELLEEIRLLSNLESQGEKLLQVFLVGQPELEGRLARAELRQLRQRIAVHYRLSPLTADDTQRYIHHRITVAGGYAPDVFPAESCAVVHELTHGIPREINQVCAQAMLNAYVEDAPSVRPEHVRAVALETEFRSVLPGGPDDTTEAATAGPDAMTPPASVERSKSQAPPRARTEPPAGPPPPSSSEASPRTKTRPAKEPRQERPPSSSSAASAPMPSAPAAGKPAPPPAQASAMQAKESRIPDDTALDEAMLASITEEALETPRSSSAPAEGQHADWQSFLSSLPGAGAEPQSRTESAAGPRETARASAGEAEGSAPEPSERGRDPFSVRKDAPVKREARGQWPPPLEAGNEPSPKVESTPVAKAGATSTGPAAPTPAVASKREEVQGAAREGRTDAVKNSSAASAAPPRETHRTRDTMASEGKRDPKPAQPVDDEAFAGSRVDVGAWRPAMWTPQGASAASSTLSPRLRAKLQSVDADDLEPDDRGGGAMRWLLLGAVAAVIGIGAVVLQRFEPWKAVTGRGQSSNRTSQAAPTESTGAGEASPQPSAPALTTAQTPVDAIPSPVVPSAEKPTTSATPAPSAKPATSPATYALAVGTFMTQDRAEEEKAKLVASTHLPASVHVVQQDGAAMYTLETGRFADRVEAERMASDLIRRGLVDEARIVRQTHTTK